MIAPYKRRRSAGLVRNLWVYRRLVAVAFVLGLTLWFIVMNNTEVDVRIPFGFGPWKTTSGVAILLGAIAGSILTALVFTILITMKRFRHPSDRTDDADPSAIPDDRPPSDYASKTKDGFPDSGWSA
ncbi:MAG: hypothetical protein JWN86_2843 [Planctomycetota bacterium]|nr:hypothetical protein [Planctomycetota bacterium]